MYWLAIDLLRIHPSYCTYSVIASLVVAETDLLLGALRQHVSVATSAPSPIVASVNNILKLTTFYTFIIVTNYILNFNL